MLLLAPFWPRRSCGDEGVAFCVVLTVNRTGNDFVGVSGLETGDPPCWQGWKRCDKFDLFSN